MGVELPEARVEQEPKGTGHFETLKQESLRYLSALTEEDSRTYERASLAVAAFIGRSLDAAALLQKELEKDSALPDGDAKKLPLEERRQYEDFIAQAEANAIAAPLLLQQARLVRFQPDIRKKLQRVSDILEEREHLLDAMEEARIALLDKSRRKTGPLRKEEIPDLAPIATIARMLREELMLRENVSPEERQYLERTQEILRESEQEYQKRTMQAGKDIQNMREDAQKKRKETGAERITQGIPGGTYLLDTPEETTWVYRRLLESRNERARARAARALREDVENSDIFSLE